MIRGGFLTAEEREDLTELARDGLAEHRLARRANVLVLLDRGMSCDEVGRVLLIDDDTVRTWHCLFQEDGIDGLAGFNYGGRASLLTLEQQEKLKGWVGETLPRTTRSVDRAGVRDRLREPLRADCAAALSGIIPFRKCSFVSILSFRLTFVLMAGCWSPSRPRHNTTMGSRPDVGAWRGSASRAEGLR